MPQGFRKSDPDQWQFSNERFIRGRRDLLKDIHRRKAVNSTARDVASVPGNSAIEVPASTLAPLLKAQSFFIFWDPYL
jgi:hypothetical protein